MSEVIGCREVSWSEELDGKELRGALGGERDQEPRGSPFSRHCLPILLHRLEVWYADFEGDVVAQTYNFELLSLLIYARSLFSQQTLSFREESPRTRAASYSRRVFDWKW